MNLIIPALLLGLFLIAALIVAIVMWLRAEFKKASPESQTTLERLRRLEIRLAVLERKLTPAPTGVIEEPAPIREPETPLASTPPIVEATPSVPAETWAGVEAQIAGSWLNRVGIVAILLAIAFFLKYAFDNDWVGPTGRVTIGILSGLLMLVWSDWLARREYTYFSEGIAGLGAGALYLSIYAAWDFYALLPQAGAFAGMIVVTAGIAAIALGRGSQRIALVALAGGYATPLLVSTGTDSQFVLFSYLLVLNGGILLISSSRDWKWLEWLAFSATLAYYIGWSLSFYDFTKLFPTAVWATLFFTQFEVLPVLHSKHTGTLPIRQVLLILANSLWYLVTLHQLLEPDHRWMLTIAVLLLSAAHLAIVQVLPKEPASSASGPTLCRILFAGLALTFVTLAVPIRLEGRWITMAWAVEGAILVRSGFAVRVRLLRGAGLLLLVTAAARAWLFPAEAPAFLLNARFTTSLLVVACTASALWFASRSREFLQNLEAEFFMALSVVMNLLLLWALSIELWDMLGRQAIDAAWDVQLSRQLGLSLLWVIYAGVLTMVGFVTSQSGWRWQGLSLFGIVVAKAFFYDLNSLDRLYRIVSFIVLGAVLLTVSFYYQRRLMARKMRSASPGEGL